MEKAREKRYTKDKRDFANDKRDQHIIEFVQASSRGIIK